MLLTSRDLTDGLVKLWKDLMVWFGTEGMIVEERLHGELCKCAVRRGDKIVRRGGGKEEEGEVEEEDKEKEINVIAP